MMQNIGISQEIAELREQIATADATIARYKSQGAAAGRETVASPSAEDAALQELVEARDFMVTRLSRLESCKRTPEA
jgi:hypothetical protein